MTTDLDAKPLFRIRVDVGAPDLFGPCPLGERRRIPLLGGTVEGAITGEVLPGSDWQIVRSDGTLEIEAHYALRTSTGALIEVSSIGLRAGPPDVIAAITRGEAVDPSRYYFRTAMRFQTSDSALTRLNSIIAIAKGERRKDHVLLDIFEVL